MISITIELMAAVRNPFPSKKRKIKLTQLQTGLSIRKLLLESGFLKKELQHLIPIINGTRTSMDYELEDGDHLWITFPLGGGLSNMNQEYNYASSIEEALNLLKKESTEIIAGGTHLATSKNRAISNFIDITRLGLGYIKKDQQFVRIGSTTTITEMIESPIISEIGNGILTKACQLIADTPLRNIITLGGNIAGTYPWVGLPVVLLVLDAEIEIKTLEGSEKVSANDYYKGGKPQKGSIITEVAFPFRSDYFCRYEKFALTTVDFSWLTMAFSAKNENRILVDPHIAISRITKAQRVTQLEEFLEGKSLSKLDVNTAVTTLRNSVKVVADYRSSKTYRKHLLGVFFRRMLEEMVGG
jgi:putative selenate reductase FAD-binding subunit